MRRWVGWRGTGAWERRFRWIQGCGRNKEGKVKVNEELRRFKDR